jgi:ribokinase
MKKIIVVGSSNTDMVIKTTKLPTPGETIIGGDFLMNAGGKGANQAVGAARLGGDVIFICKVGNDIFGSQAIEGFKKENINTEFVSVDNETPSGVALINVDAKGENSITVASGANNRLSIADIDNAENCFETGNILLVQLETPIETVEYAIKKAKNAGMTTILNPAPAALLADDIFPSLDFITPNETEAELLTGIKVTDIVSAKQAAEVLQNKGVKSVIITLGSKGAFVLSTDFSGQIETSKVEAKDSTAAGDCFNGALAVAISEGKDIQNAIKLACQAASISVTRMGAQASMPYKNEL